MTRFAAAPFTNQELRDCPSEVDGLPPVCDARPQSGRISDEHAPRPRDQGLAPSDDQNAGADRDQLRLGRLLAAEMNKNLTAKLDCHEAHLMRQLKATRAELSEYQAARLAREAVALKFDAREISPSPALISDNPADLSDRAERHGHGQESTVSNRSATRPDIATSPRIALGNTRTLPCGSTRSVDEVSRSVWRRSAKRLTTTTPWDRRHTHRPHSNPRVVTHSQADPLARPRPEAGAFTQLSLPRPQDEANIDEKIQGHRIERQKRGVKLEVETAR